MYDEMNVYHTYYTGKWYHQVNHDAHGKILESKEIKELSPDGITDLDIEFEGIELDIIDGVPVDIKLRYCPIVGTAIHVPVPRYKWLPLLFWMERDSYYSWER